MITEELEAKGAPERILKVGREVDSLLAANLNPPRHLVEVLHQWVARSNTQNRYGQ